MKKVDLKGETFLHNLFRYISWQLIDKMLIKTDITPNQITIFRTLLTLFSFWLFVQFDTICFLIGFFLFQIAEMLDSTDGDLARAKNLRSKMGVFLEIFFDTIITSVWGLLGLIFAYIAYKIDGNWIYFVLWGAIGFSVNLEKSFFIHFKGCDKAFEDAKHGHVYFGFIGKSLKEKVKNFIIVSKVWENQWLLFSGMLYFLFHIDTFLAVWVWLLLLNQMHWMRLAYQGYIKARQSK